MSSIFNRPLVVKKMAAERLTADQVFEIESNDLFTRLQESLHASDEKSEIQVSIKFAMNVLGLPQLDLELNGHLQVQCQRCMSAYAFSIQQMTQYLLFDTEQALEANSEQLGDKYETLLLPAPESSDKAREGELDLIALIEDELLLSIPLYPRHDVIDECSSVALDVELLDADQNEPEELVESDKQSPFAGLDKLLKH